MKTKRKFSLTALLIVIILGTFGRPLNVRAAEVYLKSNEAIGVHHHEIEYDNLRLEYAARTEEGGR